MSTAAKIFIYFLLFLIPITTTTWAQDQNLSYWQNYKNNYLKYINKFQPSLLVTNPFYSVKFFIFGKFTKDQKKIWNYLNQILSQAVIYSSQNKEFLDYLLKEYNKVLSYLDPKKEEIDLESLFNNFIILSYLEKDFKIEPLTDRLLELINQNSQIEAIYNLEGKNDFEKFYFLFRLYLVSNEDLKDKILELLSKTEEKVVDKIFYYSDKDLDDLVKNSPFDKLTLTYLNILRDSLK